MTVSRRVALAGFLGVAALLAACGEAPLVAPAADLGPTMDAEPADAGDVDADADADAAPDLDAGADDAGSDAEIGTDAGADPDAAPTPDAGVDSDAGELVDAGEAALDGGPGCEDIDGDGYAADTCGGSDCDDADPARNPARAEICNVGIDDDCDGLADADDGVCVACPAGFDGVDGACTDIDECAAAPCGSSAVGCTNVPGSFVCACAPGYAPTSVVGGACADADECAASPTRCGAGACVNVAGTYDCECLVGFSRSLSSPLRCVDVDECAAGSADCDSAPRATCSNTLGAYACRCPVGYAGDGHGAGGCSDVDECADGTSDCDASPNACVNTTGAFVCECPSGFVGAGRGAGGCLLDDASLLSLTVEAGARLSPVFDPGVGAYVVELPTASVRVAVTLAVAAPTRAAIELDGSLVVSGVATTLSVPRFGRVPVRAVVTTESGAMRAYDLVLVRRPAYFKARWTMTTDRLGTSVAMSEDGNTVVVGAPGDGSNATGIDGVPTAFTVLGSGAAYVYVRGSSGWVLQTYLKSTAPAPDDRFGSSVTISADGQTIVVGAAGESSNATGVDGDDSNGAATRAGAAYVFERAGGVWSQTHFLKASDARPGSYFGAGVVLSGDGSTLVVGASSCVDAAGHVGAAYVFARTPSSWAQEGFLKPSLTTPDAGFGAIFSISRDGATLAASAWREPSVYMFGRSAGVWSQRARLVSPYVTYGDEFGHALALSSAGDLLAVGAPEDNSDEFGGNTNRPGSGAVHIFAYDGASWLARDYVKASMILNGSGFGGAVAMTPSAAALVVGALGDGGRDRGIDADPLTTGALASGAVYALFRAAGYWAQDSYIKAPNTRPGQQFGNALAVDGTGTTMIVGAPGDGSYARGIDGPLFDASMLGAGAGFLY